MTTDRKICSTYRGGACSRSRSAAAAAALNDHRNLAALTHLAAVTRAHEARRFPGALRQSDLLEPPGRRCGCWRRRHFLLAELLVGRFRFGADDGALAIDADVGFAGSERRRWCRRRSSSARYGVIDNRSGKSAALTEEALALARAALRRLRH